MRFGRYTLLTPIATGGMGAVYLARMAGVEGFEKLVVIKKILPALAQEQDFVDRFVDEAKILVKLHHGSVAQVLDMGVVDDEYYIAMEFVDGKDLRKVIARCRETNQRLPVALALYVMVRVLDALAYAHRKKDENDRELNLVHRDVSPQNVLVSYEGEVKVIDFGLAKSSLSLGRTNPSIILGKFFYMSPEQARHQPVDRRSDLYAVGICLWELLTGRNPFDDVPQGELMRKVAIPTIPSPRSLRPEIPEDVEAAVMKALSIDPEERFATAEEMRGRLTAAMLELDAGAGPEALAAWMREQFAREYESERKAIASLARIDVKPEPEQVDDEFGPTIRASSEELKRRLSSHDPTPTGPLTPGDAPTFVGTPPAAPAAPKTVPLRPAPLPVEESPPPAAAPPPPRPSSPRAVPTLEPTARASRRTAEPPRIAGAAREAEQATAPKRRTNGLLIAGAVALISIVVAAALLLGIDEPAPPADVAPMQPLAIAPEPIPMAPVDVEPSTDTDEEAEEPIVLAPLVPTDDQSRKRRPAPVLTPRQEKRRSELTRLFQELEDGFERLRAIHSCERIGRLCTEQRAKVGRLYKAAIDDPARHDELERLLGDYGKRLSARRRELGVSAAP